MFHQLFCTGSFIVQSQTGEFVLQPCLHAVEHAPSPTVDAFTLSVLVPGEPLQLFCELHLETGLSSGLQFQNCVGVRARVRAT